MTIGNATNLVIGKTGGVASSIRCANIRRPWAVAGLGATTLIIGSFAVTRRATFVCIVSIPISTVFIVGKVAGVAEATSNVTSTFINTNGRFDRAFAVLGATTCSKTTPI